jgi:hypothetical protein
MPAFHPDQAELVKLATAPDIHRFLKLRAAETRE